MNNKTAKQIRKILQLTNEKRKVEGSWVTVGQKRVGIIDGVKDEIREELRERKQYFANEDVRLYRHLKKQYIAFSDVGQELRRDLNKQNDS